MSEELKLEALPCPYCGRSTERNAMLKEYVRCSSADGVCPASNTWTTIAAWNRRSPSPEFAALVEAANRVRQRAECFGYKGSDASLFDLEAMFVALAAAERALKQEKTV